MRMLDQRLSVLIPVYNEENTIAVVVKKVLALGDLVKEVVIVDDGSTDGTAASRRRPRERRAARAVLPSPKNQGKTAAIRHGFVPGDRRGRSSSRMQTTSMTPLRFQTWLPPFWTGMPTWSMAAVS